MKRKEEEHVSLSRVRSKTEVDGRIEQGSDMNMSVCLHPELRHNVNVHIDHKRVVTMDNRNVSATLGRSSDCDIRIKERTVSLLHCCLVMKVDGLHIVDLESTNGTFVKSHSGTTRRILDTHVLLHDNDLIQLDTTQCRVLYETTED